MTFTKQEAVHIQNILLLMDRGKFELTGSEAKAAVAALTYLASLKDKIIEQIKADELAAKEAEDAKAKEAEKAIETTKTVLDTLLSKQPE